MKIRQRLFLIFIFLVVIIIGLGGYAASIYKRNLGETETIWKLTRDELISAHNAQVAFEKQKLAWENLVLRGQEADLYHQYLTIFYARERETRVAVESLLVKLKQDSVPVLIARRFLADHVKLGKRFREALKIYNEAEDPSFTADRFLWDAVNNPSTLLDEVREKVVIYHEEELQLLDKKINNELTALWVISVLVLLCSMAGFVWIIDRRIGKPIEAITRAARDIRDGKLHQRVPVQEKDEFGILAETLNAMLDRLEGSNQSLEARTIELEEMNQELEAFSYTIAHDLRSPLRAITGFSQILQQDLKDNIDSEHQDALDRISAAGLRMADQIDHILKLSRISRNEIKLKDVDLSELASEIVQELQDSDPQRAVEVDIQPGLHVKGDAGMLRVVMQNLLGNAWKYTLNEKKPEIRFNGGEEKGQAVFRVTDNGAGFDMCYAHKLFGVFERLHTSEEFEGSGIGLAAAQRVIRRHGGWIKGKGELGKGADFAFTLDKNRNG